MEKKETKHSTEEKNGHSAAEKGKPAHNEKAREKKGGFPFYLAILLVVFGIAGGLALYPMLLSKPAELPGGSVNRGTFSETIIEIRVLYSSDCSICYKGTNLEALLKQRNLKFSEEKLDIKEVENGVTAGNYGMESFPTTLLNWKQLKLADPQLYKTLNSIFKANGDYLVIPEAELAREMQAFGPIMFMEAPTGEKCGVKAGTVRIEEFRDFFSEYSYKNQNIMEIVARDFNENAEIIYRNFPSTEQSKKAAIGAECAAEQGMLKQFSRALYTALFEKVENISEPSVLKKIALEERIPDLNAFDSCVDANKTIEIVEKDSEAAEQYKLYVSPSVVIDCVYTTIETTELERQICLVHPEFGICGKKES